MTSFDSGLPPIPVTTPGPTESTDQGDRLRSIRSESCYKRARAVIKITLAAEIVAGFVWLAFALVMRRGPPLLMLTAGFAAVMVVSFVGAEVAGAIFDLADQAVHDRFKSTSAGPYST
jgi:hypothetical protein